MTKDFRLVLARVTWGCVCALLCTSATGGGSGDGTNGSRRQPRAVLQARMAPEASAAPGARGGPPPPSYLGKAVLRGPGGTRRPAIPGGILPELESAAVVSVGSDLFLADGSETSLAVNSADGKNLVVAFNKGYSNSPSSLRTSGNGGLFWIGRMFPDGSGTFTGYPFDPWAAAGNSGGVLFTSLIRLDTASPLSRVVIARSQDSGIAWSRFFEATTQDAHDRAMFDLDRSAARGGGSGSEHDGAIYLTYDGYDQNDNYVASYLQVISPAGALIRTRAISTTPAFWGSHLQPVPGIEDGQVYLMGLGLSVDGRTTFLIFHEATGGGANLTIGKSILTIPTAGQPLGTSGRFGLNGHRIGDGVSLDIDRSSTRSRGYLYLLSARNPNPADPTHDQGDLYLTVSRDGALSWTSTPLPGPDPGKTQFFPALDIDDEGWIHVVYYQNETGATDGGVLNASTANVYYTVSSDGGRTWALPTRVNKEANALDYTDPPPDLSDRSYYLIGDYFQVQAVFHSGGRVVYIGWSSYDKDRTDLFFNDKRDRVVFTQLAPPPDTDRDGVFEPDDNCPTLFNPAQADGDGDGTGDVCQNLTQRANIDDAGSSRARIDGSDLFPIARAFGFCEGDPLFSATADLNPEGCVDGYDLALLTSLWGQVVP